MQERYIDFHFYQCAQINFLPYQGTVQFFSCKHAVQYVELFVVCCIYVDRYFSDMYIVQYHWIQFLVHERILWFPPDVYKNLRLQGGPKGAWKLQQQMAPVCV